MSASYSTGWHLCIFGITLTATWQDAQSVPKESP